jgi:Putative zinc-finger
MTPHLSTDQLERYRRRALPAAELLALDDHIAACEPCRERLAAAEPLADAWETWHRLLDGAPEPGKKDPLDRP